MEKIIIRLIKCYKKTISPFWASSPFSFFNSACRFCPTCSDYAVDAVSKYGVQKGTFKAVVRILRCNPFSKPGVDEA